MEIELPDSLNMGLIFFYVGGLLGWFHFAVDGPLCYFWLFFCYKLCPSWALSYVSFSNTCASVPVKHEFLEVEMLDDWGSKKEAMHSPVLAFLLWVQMFIRQGHSLTAFHYSALALYLHLIIQYPLGS